MDTSKKERKLYIWGITNVGEGIIGIISGTYLSIFLTDVALLPLAMVSAVMLITSVVDFIVAPSAGAIIVGTKAMKWGKLRSWLLVCPPICAVFSVIHFISFPGQPLLSAIIIAIGSVVSKIAWNLSYTANLALINVIAQNPKQLSDLNSQRMVGSNLGRLTGNYLTPVIVAAALAMNFSERLVYPAIMAFAGIFFILVNLIQFNIAGSYENAENTGNTKISDLSVKEIFTALATNGQLLVTVLIDLTSNVISSLQALAVYYYIYVAESQFMVANHMLLTGLAGLFGALSVRFFGKYVKDFKKYLLVSYASIAALLFSTRFVGYEHAYSMYIFLGINVVIYFFQGATQPFEMGLYMENVVYTKWKTGKDANSLIVGMSNLPVKFANIVKSVLIPVALASAGYVAGAESTPQLKQSIINAYSTVPIVFPILGFIMLRFFYKLTAERVEQMREELKQREQQ